MTTLSRSLLFVLLALPAPLAWADPLPAAVSAAASTAPPAPSTTEPSVILNSQINSGDTAWMLASMGLVLMMTFPGFALFYGGMVRKKNVLATLMQSFAITCLVTLLWVIIGYSLAFTKGGQFFGSFDRFFLNGMLFQKDAGKLTVSHLGL